MAKNKKVEEEINEEEKNEEVNQPKKEYTGDLRGFKTLKEAIDYPNTDEFKRLDIGCQTEYQEWLEKITKED